MSGRAVKSFYVRISFDTAGCTSVSRVVLFICVSDKAGITYVTEE